MFGDHGLGGLLEEGTHGKSPKCLGGNLGDFGEFCKGLRISKIGSSEIRKSLYMPAVVAYRCNAFPEFVGRLKKKEKHRKLILIAIMRKLAVIAFTLLKNGQDFQLERYK